MDELYHRHHGLAKECYNLKMQDEKLSIYDYLKMGLAAIVIGGVVSGIMLVFHTLVEWAEITRINSDIWLYCLPLGGILIVWVYKINHLKSAVGSAAVFKRIQHDETITRGYPLTVFIASIISHLCGASVGQTNASMQIGGGIADYLSSKFPLGRIAKRCLVLSGIAAAFASIFETPLAATFFAIEVTTFGSLYYRALPTCLIASYVALFINRMGEIKPLPLNFIKIPEYNLVNLVKCGLLAFFGALLAIAFVLLIKLCIKWFKQWDSRYWRIVISGSILVIIYLLFGRIYAGDGKEMLLLLANQRVLWFAFLLKMLTTAISAAGGYQGGMVTPTLVIGIMFGYNAAGVLGMPQGLGICIGLIALFVGVVNAPLCGMIMAIELFGIYGIGYYLMAVLIADQCSLDFKIFDAQEIKRGKFLLQFITKIMRRI